MKNDQYFKHDAGASGNQKIIRLIDELGITRRMRDYDTKTTPPRHGDAHNKGSKVLTDSENTLPNARKEEKKEKREEKKEEETA